MSIVSIITAFPPQCQAPDTIINTYVYFTTLPHMVNLVDEMNKYITGYYTRFSSIPIADDESGESPYWQPVESNPFDHLYVHQVEDDFAVHMKANEIISLPLHNNKIGLWELHVIVNQSSPQQPSQDSLDGSQAYSYTLPSNYKTATTREHYIHTAPPSSHMLLFRFHHVIGDGVSLMSVFSKIMRDAHGATLESQLSTYKQHRRGSGSTPKSDDTAPSSSSPTKPTSPSSSSPPRLIKKSLITYSFSFLKSFFTVLSTPMGSFDTPFAFNQCRGNTLTTYTNSCDVLPVPIISLPFIKNLKNAAGVTVNDVLFAALTGALQRYSDKVNDPCLTSHAHHQVRALLPIAKPRDQSTHNDPFLGMSNNFAFISTDMVFHIRDITQRLERIKAITSALKNGTDVAASFFCTKLAFRVLPTAIAQDTAGQLFSRHSLVFSNIPGPTTVYLGGEQVQAIQMVYPNLITQVGIISLNNRVFMNLTTNAVAIPDAHLIGPLVVEELQAMARVYRVEWQDGSF